MFAGFSVLLALVIALAATDRRSLDAIADAQAVLDGATTASASAASLATLLSVVHDASERHRLDPSAANRAALRDAMASADPLPSGVRAAFAAVEQVAESAEALQSLMHHVEDRAIALGNVLQSIGEAAPATMAARRADHALGALLLAAAHAEVVADAQALETRAAEQARLGREITRLADLALDPAAHALLRPAERFYGQLDAALGVLAVEEQRAAGPRLRLAALSEDARQQTEALGRDLTARRDAAAAELAHDVVRARLLSAALAACVLALGALLAWLTTRAVARPIRRLGAALRAMASGETEVALPDLARADIFGAMSRHLETLGREAAEQRRLAVAHEAAEARARAAHAEAIGAMAEDAAQLRQRIADQMSADAERQAALEALTLTAAEAARTAQAVTASVTGAAEHVQRAALVAGRMTEAVGEATRQIDRTAGIAASVADQARNSDQAVRGLSNAAVNIDKVVALIAVVARKTHMLAMNATIEAARAGAAGAGFAVVADEVKSLAGQTASATRQISAQMTAIQGTTAAVAAAIQGIGTTIVELDVCRRAAAAALEAQAEATREIAQEVQAIETGLRDRAAPVVLPLPPRRLPDRPRHGGNAIPAIGR